MSVAVATLPVSHSQKWNSTACRSWSWLNNVPIFFWLTDTKQNHKVVKHYLIIESIYSRTQSIRKGWIQCSELTKLQLYIQCNIHIRTFFLLGSTKIMGYHLSRSWSTSCLAFTLLNTFFLVRFSFRSLQFHLFNVDPLQENFDYKFSFVAMAGYLYHQFFCFSLLQ